MNVPVKRFRDMRLTEEEVKLRVSNYLWDTNPKRFNCGLLDRAKRLLPLWRDIGLRDLGRLQNALSRKLESDNAALAKRVAELENEKAEVSEYAEELAAMVGDLQSQLAWTPVSAGLPTEPGVYEFTVGSIVHAFWLTEPGAWRRQSGRTLDARGISAVFSGYTHYRRIELPKDGET